MKKISSIIFVGVSLYISGCASVAVSDGAIERNTAQALGIDKGSFVISDRVDDGVKSTYMVSTKSGKKYSCYVTGGVGITGKVVSDALCSELKQQGSPVAAPARTGARNQSCNALLTAAGKCQ